MNQTLQTPLKESSCCSLKQSKIGFPILLNYHENQTSQGLKLQDIPDEIIHFMQLFH
jgi:hypothetical protein